MSYDELQSLLIDVRYAIDKWHRPDARALDGLERVRETLEAECKRIKPKTHAAQLDKPAWPLRISKPPSCAGAPQ